MLLHRINDTDPLLLSLFAAWTSEIGADVSVALTNYRNEDGVKTREIALVVAHVSRFSLPSIVSLPAPPPLPSNHFSARL